jgi:hypothetical protein
MVIHFVDNSMFLIDSTRPAALKLILQRFRFPSAFERAPPDVLNQYIDSPQDFFIVLLPIEIVFP